jgi:hypothetical protein
MKRDPSQLFILLVASAAGRERASSASAAGLFDAGAGAEGGGGEAAGWVIDYVEATSHDFPDEDYDDDGGAGGGAGSVYPEVASYLLEAEADVGGPPGISHHPGVESGASGEPSGGGIFDDTPPEEGAAAAAGDGGPGMMLERQIICGYQGWFGFPGDGAPINRWRHWFRGSPTYENVTVDMYPTTGEYAADDLRETAIKMQDGSNAKFFSSARPNVVRKHFEWMAAYGITGAFNHRFMTDWNSALHETRTIVLRNVRSAAEATGRYFAVSYDIAGNGNAVIDRLKTDWMTLVDRENITNSSMYIRQNGLPVVHIYGIGFKHIPVNDTVGMLNLIRWFQSVAAGKYRVFLLGGVPGKWRDGTGDSRPEVGWKNVYNALDGLQPWHVGRWQDSAGFNRYYSDYIARDAAYCKERGILYMPTMWPGFSWHNLKSADVPRPAINEVPRRNGTFMWSQAYKYVANKNITSIWIAQFDEVDEGTAIFKVAARAGDLPLPRGGWLALDAEGRELPPDWYLRLAGEAQLMLEGKRALSPSITLDPDAPWVPRTSSPTRRPSAAPTPSVAPRTAGPTDGPTARPSSAAPTAGPTNAPTRLAAPTSRSRRISSKPASRPSKSNKKETKTSRPSPSTPPSAPKPGSKSGKKETKGGKNPPT